jgi:hypothetical protein
MAEICRGQKYVSALPECVLSKPFCSSCLEKMISKTVRVLEKLLECTEYCEIRLCYIGNFNIDR